MIDKNELRLNFPIPPSINNHYLKPRVIYRNGKATTMMYECSEAKRFKKKLLKLIKSEVEKQDFVREDNKYCIVEWVFYFPRVNMDTNNYYKCPVDCFTESKLIWEDDNLSMMVDKNIFYDAKNPHVEVLLHYSRKVGIFDKIEDFNEFIENNCNNCKKSEKIGKKGGCSIYKKALENRIQDSIIKKNEKYKCVKIKEK